LSNFVELFCRTSLSNISVEHQKGLYAPFLVPDHPAQLMFDCSTKLGAIAEKL